MKYTTLLILVIAAFVCSADYVEIASTRLSKVATIYETNQFDGAYVTTFGFRGDAVYKLKNVIKAANGEGDMELVKITDEVKWPNQATPVPSDALGDKYSQSTVVMVAGGFLVPGQSPGTIDLFDITDESHPVKFEVSKAEKGYFYHHAVWVDINQDGRKDILAARVNLPSNKQSKGELVWFEQPSSDPLANPWKEQVITNGPGVGFVTVDLDNDGVFEVIASEFFDSQALVAYWCEGSKTWDSCESIKSTILLDGKGPFFDVRYVDVNADGMLDLLTTVNTPDGTGSVYALEQPRNFRTDKWEAHLLSEGYKPLKSGQGKGGPGAAGVFFPNINNSTKTTKPSIWISGDDAATFSVLTPKSSRPSDWDYSEEFIVKSTGTIGTPSIKDLNGDGLIDILIPLYEEGKIALYTFEPESEILIR